MKPYLFLALMLLSVNSFSQQTTDSLNYAVKQHAEHDRFVSMMLKQNQRWAAGKPTSTQQRLATATKRLGSSTNPYSQDSFVCRYLGSNNSKFDFDDLDYHFDYPIIGFLSIINLDYSKTDVDADTLEKYYNGSYQTTRTLKHSTAGKLTHIDYGSPTPAWCKFYNQYDANNRIIESVSVSILFSPNSLDSTEKLVFYYDLQGNRMVDSVYRWDKTDSVWLQMNTYMYYHSTNGNLDSMFEYASDGSIRIKCINEFYPNNLLKQTITSWPTFTDYRDSFEYRGSSADIATKFSSKFNGSGWTPREIYRRTFNTQSLPDTLFVDLFSTVQETWVMSYNSYNNPDSICIYKPGSNKTYETRRYSYEVFNSPAGIKDETAKEEDIQLYPNPTEGEATLYWRNANGQRATIECVNSLGQRVFSQSFLWRDPKHSISLAGLETGIYSIIIRNADGDVVSSQQVLMQ